MMGLDDIVDLSEINFDFDGELFDISGNVTSKMEGVDPTDRLDLEIEVFKMARGAWQMTPYSIRRKDFCRTMWNTNTLLYEWVFKYVPKEEQLCPTNYNHTYHTIPFKVNPTMEFALNMEGRYKVQFITILDIEILSNVDSDGNDTDVDLSDTAEVAKTMTVCR
ncbi:uncharacterized protein LOC131997054 [Stomoxys calcitrans]|uniref:uncharacterized protein LOC131997054 n=1 Tax=Stomoxys calcitrans TaxID=35570 RepID=UPI0027E2AE71|nr:uncharacterized protein LOC131997054 [Stomoxys calcitrans]